MADFTPYVVGISGGSASGKTWFIKHLLEKMGQTQLTVISQDHYYKPITAQEKDENGEVNFDLPQGLNLDTLYHDIERLKNGETISLPAYHFNNPGKEPEMLVFEPSKLILVEGIFLFHHAMLSKLFDLKIFIEAPSETKLQRRLKRDMAERAISEHMVHYQWQHHVVPAYEQFILPYRESADMVLHNWDGPNKSIEILVHYFKNLLS